MNEYFAQTLAQVLEETSSNMANQMTLDHLAKNGAVTLEEAEFFQTLCTDVITEAAEDFIPDTVEVPDAPEEQAPMELFDAVGNKYVFQDGQLIPVDDTQDDDGMQDGAQDGDGDLPVDAEPAPEAEPDTAPDTMQESTIVGDVENVDILEESDSVVAKILANLK